MSLVKCFLYIFTLIFLYGKIQGFGIVKPAYMGNIWQNTYVLHTERKNWLGALNTCHAKGINIQFNDWKYVNWYIRIKAERLGWNTTEDVWIGLIKHQDSHVWYDVRKDRCERTDVYYPGQLYHERQCAVLNMSGSVFAGNSHIIYAENCEGRQLGFACITHHGLIPTSVEYYPMYEVVEKGSRRHSYNCSSAEECAITVFSTLMCYVATYYPGLELCEADCTDMDNILDNVTLVTTTINATVILRTYNKVRIEYTVTSLPNISGPTDYPCITLTTTKTDYSTSSNLPTSTTTTEQSSGNCHCVCPSTANMSSKDLLMQRIDEIKEELTVVKTSLSSSVRKRTSAPDERQSSATMGKVGICIIVGTLFSLVAGDICCVVNIMVKLLKNKLC
uniref:Uncharacterized protein LOC111125970 n=1 Tax=Crassostrea virginica TaxID=6565 RepID=A0A8B8DE76_CRAVI|nr:uncharacterized protein LOC111125970 [Crassostrea virginica]